MIDAISSLVYAWIRTKVGYHYKIILGQDEAIIT